MIVIFIDNVIKLRSPRLPDDNSPPSPDIKDLWAKQQDNDINEDEQDDDEEYNNNDDDNNDA